MLCMPYLSWPKFSYSKVLRATVSVRHTELRGLNNSGNFWTLFISLRRRASYKDTGKKSNVKAFIYGIFLYKIKVYSFKTSFLNIEGKFVDKSASLIVYPNISYINWDNLPESRYQQTGWTLTISCPLR